MKTKYTRVDTGVKKGKFVLIFDKSIISGDCTFIAKKYKDGAVIFEITYVTQLPKRRAKVK